MLAVLNCHCTIKHKLWAYQNNKYFNIEYWLHVSYRQDENILFLSLFVNFFITCPKGSMVSICVETATLPLCVIWLVWWGSTDLLFAISSFISYVSTVYVKELNCFGLKMSGTAIPSFTNTETNSLMIALSCPVSSRSVWILLWLTHSITTAEIKKIAKWQWLVNPYSFLPVDTELPKRQKRLIILPHNQRAWKYTLWWFVSI